jgi:hypothetical protein
MIYWMINTSTNPRIFNYKSRIEVVRYNTRRSSQGEGVLVSYHTTRYLRKNKETEKYIKPSYK